MSAVKPRTAAKPRKIFVCRISFGLLKGFERETECVCVVCSPIVTSQIQNNVVESVT